jgi:hypothetical protein
VNDAGKGSPGTRILSAVGLVALLAFLFSSSAAAQITVGQTAPGFSPPAECEEEFAFDEWQRAVAVDTTSYVVPTAGVLTSWSTNAAAGPNQILTLKVLHRVGALSFAVAAHDGPRPLAPGVLNTFPIAVPVKQGDAIGLNTPTAVPTACTFATGLTEDSVFFKQGDVADGGTIAFGMGFNSSRLNVSATLLPPPSLSAIAPVAGPVTGGTSVVLSGANFADVTAVSFGAAPAKSFAVGSESQITAVAPAASALTGVPISVSTVAGTAASAQLFTYDGCRVPRLRDSKLKRAKKAAKKAACKIGTIKKLPKAKAKTGKVVKQNPKPGKLLAPGTKITVTLGV